MNTTKPTDPIDIMWRRYRAEKRLDDMPDTRIAKIENAFPWGNRKQRRAAKAQGRRAHR